MYAQENVNPNTNKYKDIMIHSWSTFFFDEAPEAKTISGLENAACIFTKQPK